VEHILERRIRKNNKVINNCCQLTTALKMNTGDSANQHLQYPKWENWTTEKLLKEEIKEKQ